MLCVDCEYGWFGEAGAQTQLACGGASSQRSLDVVAALVLGAAIAPLLMLLLQQRVAGLVEWMRGNRLHRLVRSLGDDDTDQTVPQWAVLDLTQRPLRCESDGV